VRSELSFATPPEEETAKGPALAVAWDRSFSAEATSFLFSPWTWTCAKYVCVLSRSEDRETYLVCSATGQRTKCALDSARGLVNVALESRGLVLVVGRHCDGGCLGV
jgi:hypothetical protein